MGKTIKVKVSFTDDAGYDESLTSGATASVAARPNTPATGAPTVSGIAQVGEMLTAETSGIADTDGLSNAAYSYQWVRNDGNTNTDITGAADSTYALVAADVGKTIKVRVYFMDDAGNDEILTSTATVAVAEPDEPPAQPQGLTGTVAHDAVSLTWNDPGDATITGYQILRRDRALHGKGDFQIHVDDTGSSGTSYADFTVEAGAEYVYRVKARNAAGLSTWSGLFRADTTSGPIQGVPAQPSPPTVTEVAHDTVTISWTAPGDSSITGYQVLRRKRGEDGRGVFELVEDDTGNTTTSYTDSSVVASTAYGYRVRARNAHGLSERSASVGVETSAAPEPTPMSTPEPTPEHAPAQQEQADVPTWSAEVTVGAYNRYSPPMIGYSTWSQTGAVSDRDFEMDGTTYRVLALTEQAGGLYLVTTLALPVEFTLAAGDQEFAASDSSVPATAGAGRYWWQTGTELFADGETVSLSITAAEDTEASANRPLAPPTAYFSYIPASHNGADELTLRVSFGEEVSLTATTLQDHALVATGATVTAVAQRTANSTKTWNVTVQPGGTADITVGLAATTACDQTGAVCTSDGRHLHNQPRVAVPGHAIAQLSDLTVTGLSLSPAFSPAEILYTAQASTGLTEVTVTATPPRDDITVEIAPEDADTTTPGHQIALVEGDNTVTVTVTGSDGATLVYTVTITPEAFAQTDVPDAPTAVAVYRYWSQKLEVRWSSSDAATTSAFKIQWKSGSEEFDSSRQHSTNRSSSNEPLQSTSAGGRYRYKITGLTNGIEYTVRVIATNANGDSDPSGEATGTPQPTPGQVRLFIENEVIEIFEGSHPWLRDTWDYITTQNVTVEFTEGTGGSVSVACAINDPLEPNLRKCDASLVQVGRFNPRMIYMITHELAHVYTLANAVTSTSGPLGVSFLYFYDLISPRYDLLPPSALLKSRCRPMELYADALSFLTHGDRVRAGLYYWQRCTLITDTVSDQAVAVVRNAATGEMPSWFADTYDDPDGDPDLARFWSDVKAIPNFRWRATAVFQLRDAFGGYCDNQKATDSAFGSGVTRIPWSDGGCVPEAPTNVSSTAVGSGKLTVSWQEPLDDGGSPVEGYKVQWKSGTQEYGSSRQAVVTNLTDPQQTISGLTNDESHSLRVLAYNHNGDGAAAETTAMPTATDTTAPALLTARVDRDFSFLRLTWNEALDESSVPARSAFTVNVNGVSRPFSAGVLDNVVTLSLALAGGVKPTDAVTVGYTAPTGPTASPLRDSAGNNAADFSAQMVRNDATHVALTSDPGLDRTYSWNNGSGRQDVIEATVTFSEPVLVSGVPELKLYVGGKVRRAAYRSGSGTTSLVFRYVLTEGETDNDGISVAIGSIAGLVRYTSTKAVAPGEVVLGPQAGHLVDAVPPALVHANAFANGNDLTLRWDEALDEDSVPTRNDPGFEVRDTSDNTSRQISAISVQGRVVTLTLSSAVSGTDQLTVSYDVPSYPLKDTVGNYAGETSAAVSITLHPNSPPEFSTAEDGTRSVDENTPARRNIGTPIAATDADSDGLTYSISGMDAAFFDVVAPSGQLRTKAALDHESRDNYSFTMPVTDGKDVHGNADTTVDDTISVTVTVEDVDEPPEISGTTTIDDYDENGTGDLAIYTDRDPEGAVATFAWSLSGADRDDFEISETGVNGGGKVGRAGG